MDDEANEIPVVDTGWDGVKAPLPIFDIVNGFFKSIAVRRRFGMGSAGRKADVERNGSAVITIKAEISTTPNKPRDTALPSFVSIVRSIQCCRWWCGLSSVR